MNDPRFSVECPDAQAKYDGRSVIFRLEQYGELRGLQGKFRVHHTEEGVFVDVECCNVPHPAAPATTEPWVFHLGQEHVDSIIPVSEPGSGVDHEVQIPLLSHHCLRNTSTRPPES